MPHAIEQVMGDLVAEADPRKRQQLLRDARDLWSPATIKRFYEETVRLLHVDVQQAERMARSSLWLSERIGDDTSLSTSRRAMAHIYYRKRKYAPSVEMYHEALAI